MLMNRPVTLRQIEIFVHIAKTGNLTVAAKDLSLSQSAASMSLKELERLLEGPLFSRIGRGMVLNDRGRFLLPLAENVLAAVRDFTESGRAGSDLAGELIVACSTTIANYLFPRLMKNFMEAHPGVSIVLRVGNTQEIAEEVLNGTADLGLVEGELECEGLVEEDWVRDELVIFAPPGHPLVGCGPVPLKRLARETWILREKGSGTLSTLLATLEDEGVSLSRTIRIGHTEAIKRAVEAGMGLSCLSRVAVERELLSGQIALIESPLRPHRWFRFITHPQGYASRVLQAMLQWLRVNRRQVS